MLVTGVSVSSGDASELLMDWPVSGGDASELLIGLARERWRRAHVVQGFSP
jgi:hypothetical protein